MMRAENFLRPAVAFAVQDIPIGLGSQTRLDVFRKWVG